MTGISSRSMQERCSNDNITTSLPFSDHHNPNEPPRIPSPNHGTIACLVATLLCWMGLSGARLIRKNFLLAISDYGHPTNTNS